MRDDTASDDATALTEVSLGNNSSILNIDDLSPSTNDHICISIESSADSSMAETEPSIADDGCNNSRKGPDLNFDCQNSIATETSGESSIEEKYPQNLGYVDNMMSKTTGDMLSPTFHLSESQSSTSFADSDLASQDWHKLGDPDDSKNDVSENVPSITETVNTSDGTEMESLVHSDDNSYINANSPPNLSLEEKVAKFIQNGDLDPVEGTAKF